MKNLFTGPGGLAVIWGGIVRIDVRSNFEDFHIFSYNIPLERNFQAE